MSRTPVPVLAAPPIVNLAPRDVEALVEELQAYHAIFSPLFRRREQRAWGLQYLHGQLLDLPRKSIEPMALALPDGNVRAMQQFIGEGAWDDAAILATHQRVVAETLGDPEGVLIVDGSEFPKQGSASVGVARQYCGALGKVANCQAGVFVAYASRKGYTLLDRRLYMPAEWFTPASAHRRQRCGVPPTVRFRTAPQLAGEMVDAVHTQGRLPVGWVVFDEASRVPAGAPRPQRVDDVARRLPATAWREYVIKDGATGVIRAAFAFLRVHPVRDRVPGLAAALQLRGLLVPP